MDREPTPKGGRGADLLERDAALATLDEAFAAGRRGEGRLVPISGDAGIGESALVRAFCSHTAAGARVLLGACDGLRTPRPLGPLADIGRAVGGRLGDATLVGDPRAARGRLRSWTSCARAPPTIVVFEDVHWADEATLDGPRHARADAPEQLGRARRSSPTAPTSCCRPTLCGSCSGDLATAAGVLRVAAPAVLARGGGRRSPRRTAWTRSTCTRRTAGNPFFVTEVLAAGADDIPGTIRDAVLARAARLGGAGRAHCSRRSPSSLSRRELWLHEAIAPGDAGRPRRVPRLRDACARNRHAIAFRHELARMAIEDSVNPHRLSALHQRCSAGAAAGPPSGVIDHARLAHPPRPRATSQAVLELAPAAGVSGRPPSAPTARRPRNMGGPCATRVVCRLLGARRAARATILRVLPVGRAGSRHRRAGRRRSMPPPVRGRPGRGPVLSAPCRPAVGAPADPAGGDGGRSTMPSPSSSGLGPGPELAAAYAGRLIERDEPRAGAGDLRVGGAGVRADRREAGTPRR